MLKHYPVLRRVRSPVTALTTSHSAGLQRYLSCAEQALAMSLLR